MIPFAPRAALLLAALSLGGTAFAQRSRASVEHRMVRVAGGTFSPFYRTASVTRLTVRPFRLDQTAVTNADFLAFVQANPRWRRGAVPAIFADAEYLSHWASPTALGPAALPAQPVTRVSWFAARAYCEARGARLPTEAEWEWAARADERSRDGTLDPGFNARILAWYGRAGGPALLSVRSTVRNVWGAWDMHGLVWEWVEDFGQARALSDNRERGAQGDTQRFCGASALDASDRADYAAFMRYAFRTSLQGAYTVRNLGFRCAMDMEVR